MQDDIKKHFELWIADMKSKQWAKDFNISLDKGGFPIIDVKDISKFTDAEIKRLSNIKWGVPKNLGKFNLITAERN
jgi:hypothetical protein